MGSFRRPHSQETFDDVCMSRYPEAELRIKQDGVRMLKEPSPSDRQAVPPEENAKEPACQPCVDYNQSQLQRHDKQLYRNIWLATQASMCAFKTLVKQEMLRGYCAMLASGVISFRAST